MKGTGERNGAEASPAFRCAQRAEHPRPPIERSEMKGTGERDGRRPLLRFAALNGRSIPARPLSEAK